MAKRPNYSAASVKQRLLNIARQQGRVFDVVLVTYGLERLLYRLSKSEHRDSFVLKGGMLVALWTGNQSRATRDADFLSFGDASEDHLRSVFTDIMNIQCDDGVLFDAEALTTTNILEAQQYTGIRLKTVALLGTARIPITIDIGFGDALSKSDYSVVLPALLDMPAAHVRAYSPATVIAEKFHAIVMLGLANTRMKDYYDLFAILSTQNIPVVEISEAILGTFERRKTLIPQTMPDGLTRTFATDSDRTRQWAAYASSIDLTKHTLEDVTATIWKHLNPVCKQLGQ